MAKEIWTIGKLLSWTENYFRQKGIDSPRLDAEVLLGFVLKKERIYLYVHFDEPLNETELAEFKSLIKRRVDHEPVAYIVGKKEFMGLTFTVSPAVLTPRADTEILVEAVLKRLPEREARIADIGTGSGAIGLSLAHFNKKLSVTLTDICENALEIARENTAVLELTERTELLLGDMLSPLTGKFCAIVSNPPYIPRKDIETLMPEVRDYEPRTALLGGEDGLDFYRILAKESGAYLENGGLLAVEVGMGEARAVEELFKSSGFTETEIIPDYAGIERVVLGYAKQ